MIDNEGLLDTSSMYSRADEPDVIVTLLEVLLPSFCVGVQEYWCAATHAPSLTTPSTSYASTSTLSCPQPN